MKKILSLLKKNALILALCFVCAIIGLGVYLISKMEKSIKNLESEIKTQYGEEKTYELEKQQAPSPELIARLEKQQAGLTGIFNSALAGFSTTWPEVPAFKQFPDVQYKEFLLETEDYLLKKARRNAVSLPASLGFSETGFPSQSQIPVLSLQLTVLKNLLGFLIDAGVTQVDSVAPGAPAAVAFYRVLPLDVKITGDSIQLMRFLQYLDSPSSFFTLESFSIVKNGPDLFNADFNINAVLLKTESVTKGAQ